MILEVFNKFNFDCRKNVLYVKMIGFTHTQNKC
jgi:hypothetical protein